MSRFTNSDRELLVDFRQIFYDYPMFDFFDITTLVKTAGYLGLFVIIFAESGLFFGFFLPGDSLLFTAGFLASQGFFDIRALIIIVLIGAIMGDNVGYWFGRKIGPKIFTKEDSFFFRKSYVHKAQEFFEKHGAKTIVLARFVPPVRTFAPIIAGVANMRYETFLAFNVVGGLVWGLGLTSLGYFLGNTIPHIDRYIFPILAFIIIVSLIPGVVSFWKNRKKS